jgi:hypothetical protein
MSQSSHLPCFKHPKISGVEYRKGFIFLISYRLTKLTELRSEVLTAASKKMVVFWVVAP